MPMNFSSFSKLPLLGILRGVKGFNIEPIAKICTSTGLQAIEITMNTEGAKELISQMKYFAQGNFSVGAGTVLTYKDLDAAIGAGAEFIVMPSLQVEVMRICVSQNIPVFPGAFTPTEIYKAWDLGATMVKVFPSSLLGPSYFKEIKGPLDSVKLLACGGVSEHTIAHYFSHGADAAAFGASVFKPEWLLAENYSAIEKSIQTLMQAYFVARK